MLIVRVAGGEHVADGGGGAVVKTGRRTPKLHEGGGVEFVGGFVAGGTGTDAVPVQVGVNIYHSAPVRVQYPFEVLGVRPKLP